MLEKIGREVSTAVERVTEWLQAAPLLPALGAVLMGGLQCFSGYRLLRFWITLSGFGVGMITGYMVSSILLTEAEGQEYMPVLIGLGAGILCAFAAHRVYLAGVFLFCGIMAFTALSGYTFPEGRGWDIFGFAARIAAFLIVGYIGMKFARPAVILISGLAGSASAVRALPAFVPVLALDQELRLLLFVLTAAAGIVVQTLTTRGK